MAVIVYPKQSITVDNIQEIVSTDGVRDVVATNTRTYQSIDVSETMRHLGTVGNLIELAYCGAKGFKCAPDVMEIMTTYQTLINNSLSTAASFVEKSIHALSFHEAALEIARAGDEEGAAIELITSSGDLAKGMADESAELVRQADKLSEIAKRALISATKDESCAADEKRRVQEQSAALSAKQAKLKTKTAELDGLINEARQNEHKAAKDAKNASTKAFAIGIISSIMAPITTIASTVVGGMVKASGGGTAATLITQLTTQKQQADTALAELRTTLLTKQNLLANENDETKKAALQTELAGLTAQLEVKQEAASNVEKKLKELQDSLKDEQARAIQKEEEAAAKRRELQAQHVEANADLAEAVERLKSLSAEENNLSASIVSLEVAIGALAKVRTTFENTRLFWVGVEKQCKALANITILKTYAKTPALKQRFIQKVEESGFSWLTLAHLNQVAQRAIESVKASVDGTMQNIPTKEEAVARIAGSADTMIAQLREESRQITEG